MSASRDRAYVIRLKGMGFIEPGEMRGVTTSALGRAKRYATVAEALDALRRLDVANEPAYTILPVVRQGLDLDGWIDVDPLRYQLLYPEENRVQPLRIPGAARLQAATEVSEEWVEASEEEVDR